MSPQPLALRALTACRPLASRGSSRRVDSLHRSVQLLSRPLAEARARTYARICSARGSLSRSWLCATGEGARQAVDAAPQRSSCLGPRRQQRAVHNTTPATTTATMDPGVLKHYLADSPPTVVPLAIKPHFEALSDHQKLYSHYLSMSATPRLHICLSLSAGRLA